MKEGIHPTYHVQVIECVCGAKYNLGSTKKIEKIDICAGCHPFFTGKTKIIDTEGRIDKFKKKFGDSYANLKK